MATTTFLPLAVPVNPETAKAFELASTESRDELQAALGQTLERLLSTPPANPASIDDVTVSPGPRQPSVATQEWRTALANTFGIWKDREDLPPLEELRKEWDRYE